MAGNNNNNIGTVVLTGILFLGLMDHTKTNIKAVSKYNGIQRKIDLLAIY